ncbi:hypothetical protein D9M72_638130 [compost metagenome]
MLVQKVKCDPAREPDLLQIDHLRIARSVLNQLRNIDPGFISTQSLDTEVVIVVEVADDLEA